MELVMFELVRYTFLVLLGLTSIVALFISIPLLSGVIIQSGDFAPEYNHHAATWMWGIAASSICLWLSSSFLLKVPATIISWLSINKDNIAAYSVISLIFIMFVVV
jgi:hypothetical protein